MPKPIVLGGITFPSKADAEMHIRGILSRYSNMEPLQGDDLAFAFALIEAHPSRYAIVDCGIRTVVVQHLQDRRDSRRFLAVRTDSSIRDFTWRVALHPKTARARVMKACRYAVKEQIRSFRGKQFAGEEVRACPVSGRPISARECDVDHVPPRTFEKLVESWLRSAGIDAEDVALVPVSGYEQPDRWEDAFLEENWREYHRLHAVLRVVHPWANRSTIRKQANEAA